MEGPRHASRLRKIQAPRAGEAVRLTAHGESLFAPSILTRLIAHHVAAPRPERPAGVVRRLTPREVEVLALIGNGLANDEIAAALDIAVKTVKTVKTHITRLLAKPDAHDRARLVIAAFGAGLVRPGTSARTPGRSFPDFRRTSPW